MFPEYRDLISKLKQEDSHFARLFDEHNELDDKIAGLVNNPVTSGAEAIEELNFSDGIFIVRKGGFLFFWRACLKYRRQYRIHAAAGLYQYGLCLF